LRGTTHGNFGTDTQRFEDRLRLLQSLTFEEQIWNHTHWTNLSIAECKEYTEFETSRGSVLLVAEDQFTPGIVDRYYDFDLLQHRASSTAHQSTVLEYALYPEHGRTVETMLSYSGYHVSYCLSLKVPGRCRLQIHVWLLLTVVACNIVKLVCFILTFKEQHGTPLMIVGDAIASFLDSPCSASHGMCLLPEDELISAVKAKDGEDGDVGSLSRQYRARHLRYYQSISFVRWTIYVTSYEKLSATPVLANVIS
jgi:hypothetical protein